MTDQEKRERADHAENDLINSGQVPVTPLASIRRFTSVQILTRPQATGEEASTR